MPSFDYDGVSIYYEEFGAGFPLLTFAPGGLMSRVDVWQRPAAPIDPTNLLAADYRVIAMDQRNAGGRSAAPITARDGWPSYAADHIALLDHLGIDRCHLLGQCIGGPFILALLRAQPERFFSAVIVQPIGRVGPMPAERSANFQSWAELVKDRPEINEELLDAFNRNLYAPGFAYSVDRDFVRGCQTPCLVFPGDDAVHPYAFAAELAQLLPNAEFIAQWRDAGSLPAATERIRRFLAEHTPVRV